MEPSLPTAEEISRQIQQGSNWDRWGSDDQRGAINLITPEKRRAATRLVKSGRTVSLSRDYPKEQSPANQKPAEHRLSTIEHAGGRGAAVDYYGISFHGLTSTHIDALCHVWDESGLWNGRDPSIHITPSGSSWGGIEQWRDGIVTRGVLLDVPRYRGVDFVEYERPVHGWELEEILAQEGLSLGSGDAVAIYSGRDAWSRANPEWGSAPSRPGLHGSCLGFLRAHDCSVLVWDMMEVTPTGYDEIWAVHAASFVFGMAFVDNALLEPLAQACAEEGRSEFMLAVAPLPVIGGTGSPVNPIAIL